LDVTARSKPSHADTGGPAKIVVVAGGEGRRCPVDR
jgi:hypothetical protein